MSPGIWAPLEAGKGKEPESPQSLQEEHSTDDTFVLLSGTYKCKLTVPTS